MTDKLREAALCKLLTEARETLWQPANPDLCGRIDEALAQQESQKKHKPLFAEMIAQHPGLAEELVQQDAQVVPPRTFVVMARRRLPSGRYSYTVESDVPLPIGAPLHADPLNAAPTPPAQQDAQVVQEPCAVVKWQTGGPVVHIIGEVQVGDLLYRAAPTPPAQQDAQAVAQDEIVAAWKSGMTVQYFVTIGHDDEWTDYTNPTPPDTSGTRLAWRVKPGQRSNAAPTPPAQRVMLTDEEVIEVWTDIALQENGSGWHAIGKRFARAVIEAYERKNGIK